ncbi:MAG TPA: hypothetical protein VF502_08845 [Stellaceae bacterium]
MAALATTTTWWIRHDPLYFLPRSASAPAVQLDRLEHRAGRVFEHLTLSDTRLGSIGLTVSLPDPPPGRKLPLVVVLGGLGTGEHNIRAIHDAGDNVVVGYDWPLATVSLKSSDVLRLPALRAQALSVPGQVTAALHWLVEQPWADADRVSLVGFSLGSVAAPAVQRVAMAESIRIGWTVLAYGGAPIDALVRGHRRIRPSWVRPLLAFGAEFLLAPVDPALHLPALAGRFLVLGSTDDSILSEEASRSLEALTPVPKVAIRLPGDHVGTGPDREALLDSALAVTRCWLMTEGAVNSPELDTDGECEFLTRLQMESGLAQ